MSKLANMSEDLRKARVLTEKFPPAESIKLHPGQCSRLRAKVIETLNFAEKGQASCRYPAHYTKVFREFWRVVIRVKTFTDDCCYNCESDFVLAAIKVSAHKERFIKYLVELDWCIFLIERVRDAKGKQVASEELEGFKWKEKVKLFVEETEGIVEKDFIDFKDVLLKHVQKPGDHQKICATLLRRFKKETDPVVDDFDLEVPPIERKRERIGKGGFGEVYSFKWKRARFAIKIPSADSENLDTEVKILEKCSHPNIVNLILFHKYRDGKQFLMMEKLSMNLLEFLKSVATGLSVLPLEAVDMILQVCEGLEYLGDIHRVSHRDLKPENILVKLVSGQDRSVLELQVADFGLAKVREAIEKSSKHTPNVGTTRYRAPEMTGAPEPGEDKIHVQSLKADMFSFAVTCSCILTGCEPYEETIRAVGMEGLRKFVKKGGRPSLPADCPAGLTSLLEECWHPEPSKRPASFSAICERLRKLKAILLTSDVHEGDKAGTSSTEVRAISASVLFREVLPCLLLSQGAHIVFPVLKLPNGRMTFQPGVRPLRILVLGNAKLAEATCMSICGASELLVEDHIPLQESVSIAPPMCLYRVAANGVDSRDYTDIMRFVKARNKRWQQGKVKAAWTEDLYYSREDSTPFPNSSRRLHMAWYVCESQDDFPNAFRWGYITKKLCGVPVQMLVTKTELYENNLRLMEYFFHKSQLSLDDLIIKVDLEELKDAEAKDRLLQISWDVKTKVEIRNAAMIIGYIREQLGSSGIVIPVGIAARRRKEFSVDRSKAFIRNFLCSYWDAPLSFEEVLPSMRNPQEGTKFVSFCLQDAATILYWEREHIHGSVPAEASAEFVLRETQACAKAYFTNLDLDACDKMKSGDIQGFLEAVFKNRMLPQSLVSELDRRWSFSKFIERLRSSTRRATTAPQSIRCLWTVG